ncbi:PREDICTED: FT-interacting protein 1-like [Tarenaya hassleriana]|uniref:FT-interacting protein 1-like n=1 Tax=Tarenaya hassleriana TaxID=28532 RepID=UPI00053C0E47|nr:PREDICTED: FT-interacting protein 1-like [Tarenaya hassleriana]
MVRKDDFSCKKIFPKIGGGRANSTKDKLTSSFDLVEEMHFLYIEINRVINCPAGTCSPFVELTLGNYRASTRTLPTGPDMEWNQAFAFDKTKGDVLEVVLKDGRSPEYRVIGKISFKLVIDIPTRVPPDARIAPQWYALPGSGNDYSDSQVELLMSLWFGTQADEVYSVAWFSDTSGVSADTMINTHPKVYMAPRLCYVRVHIVSAHDLIATDKNRTPQVYVKAVLGNVALKTKVASGPNPSWNQDLMFVASDPLQGTVFISLMDCLDDEHEECIGKLKKKLSEMTPLKLPGVAPALFYDIEMPGKVEPVGVRNFASKIKMKLSTEQAYHVFDESSQFCSDYRAFAKALWSGQIGTLEIGILGATGLQPMKTWTDGKKSADTYVVAKYGNKWIRTRTVVDSLSPKWNEQYTWEVYDAYTVVTFGLYDNCQIFGSNIPTKDVRIGKVRIRISLLRADKIYACSFPIIDLGRNGVKKMGEIQLAVRFNRTTSYYNWIKSYYSWMLPKMHYKSPLSILQIENLRQQAVQATCQNLARMEPPLRSEVVQDILHVGAQRWSMRKAKANFDRLCKVLEGFLTAYVWLNNQSTSTEWVMKMAIVVLCGLFLWCPEIIPLLALGGCIIIVIRNLIVDFNRRKDPFAIDAELSKLDLVHPDELDEEFDTFPSSVMDINVLRMRYDRLRKMMERVTTLMGDLASQGERICSLMSWRDERATFYFFISSLPICLVLYHNMIYFGYLTRVLLLVWIIRLVQFPCLRNDLPSGINNFFRRLPTREDNLL